MESETIDYDEMERLAKEHRPKMIIAGASAYPRIIDFERFADVAKQVGAVLMVDMAHIAGLVATGAHPSPVPYADFVTSTSHKTLRGPRSGFVLCKEEWAAKLDKAVFPGLQGGPLEHIIAAKAVAFREAMQPEFTTYIDQVVVNARAMGEAMVECGLRLISGGTDNHLLLVDLRPAGITGKDAERLLEDVGITTNKNSIPNDPESPFVTSGIRVGSPAMTTRGFTEAEAHTVGSPDRADRLQSRRRGPRWPTSARRSRRCSTLTRSTRSFVVAAVRISCRRERSTEHAPGQPVSRTSRWSTIRSSSTS